MAETKVIATLTEAQGGPREIECVYDFGDNLEQAVEMFGEDAVFGGFKAQSKINVQALIRRHMKPDKDGNQKSDSEIQAEVTAWKPGVRSVTRKSAVEKAKDLLGGMSAEEKQKLLADLMAQANEPALDEEVPEVEAPDVA